MFKACSIVLGAGEGKRMKCQKPKVLSEVLFKPMIKWVIDSIKSANINDICVVSGYKHELLENYLYSEFNDDIKTVFQAERKGTAHAVMVAEKFFNRKNFSDVLIVNGDSPFIDSENIANAYKLHKKENNAVTVISAKIDNPFGYGRIIRNKNDNSLASIVEQKDATIEEQNINEVNSGAYWFNVESLISILYKIKNENAQGEYYLPDAVHLILKKGDKAGAFIAKNHYAVLGANDFSQLNKLNSIARFKILDQLRQDGINIPFDDGVIIGPDVKIGSNSVILPGSIICGNVTIGNSCKIGPNTFINNCIIGNNVTLNSVECLNYSIGDNQEFGPFEILKNQ